MVSLGCAWLALVEPVVEGTNPHAAAERTAKITGIFVSALYGNLFDGQVDVRQQLASLIYP